MQVHLRGRGRPHRQDGRGASHASVRAHGRHDGHEPREHAEAAPAHDGHVRVPQEQRDQGQPRPRLAVPDRALVRRRQGRRSQGQGRLQGGHVHGGRRRPLRRRQQPLLLAGARPAARRRRRLGRADVRSPRRGLGAAARPGHRRGRRRRDLPGEAHVPRARARPADDGDVPRHRVLRSEGARGARARGRRHAEAQRALEPRVLRAGRERPRQDPRLHPRPHHVRQLGPRHHRDDDLRCGRCSSR